MSIMTNLSTIARNWRRRRLAARTERRIGSLPFEVRKDIGWPDRYTSEIGRHPAHDAFGR
jgi:hypothetical protein